MDRRQEAVESPDLIQEILLRLPAKSVARFRCVSKLWSSITTNPSFISSFATHQSSTQQLCFMVKRRETETVKIRGYMYPVKIRDKIFFISLPQHEHPDKSCVYHVDRYQMSFPNPKYQYSKAWSKPVHGLMVFGKKYEILVWNPTTRQHVILPKPMFKFKWLCLGYDPVEDKHKVLIFSRDLYKAPLVFSLGPQESWRETQNIPLHDATRRTGICINGHVYYQAWILNDTSGYREKIFMSFNVRYETFNKITIPAEDPWGRPNFIFNYQGKLAWFFSENVFSLSFWVLEDEKKQEWSLRNFLLPSPLRDSISEAKMSLRGVTHDTGEFVYIALRFQTICVLYYDPKTNRTRRVEYGGVGDYNTSLNDVYCYLNHSESLVSLENVPRAVSS